MGSSGSKGAHPPQGAGASAAADDSNELQPPPPREPLLSRITASLVSRVKSFSSTRPGAGTLPEAPTPMAPANAAASPHLDSALPEDVLVTALYPLLSREDLASLRATCRRMRDAFRRSTTCLTFLVTDESLPRLAAWARAAGPQPPPPLPSTAQRRATYASEGAGDSGSDDAAAGTCSSNGGSGGSALGALYPSVRHLTLRAGSLYDAVACATPADLAALLPPGLRSLALNQWHLHDQAAQLAAIGAACGRTLASLELRDAAAIQDLVQMVSAAAVPAAAGAGSDGACCAFPALRSVAVTATGCWLGPFEGTLQHGAGADASGGARAWLPASWDCHGSVRRHAGCFEDVTLLLPRVSSSGCAPVGDGRRAHDPTLNPLAFRSAPASAAPAPAAASAGGAPVRFVSAKEAYARRSGRSWGCWLREDARARGQAPAAQHPHAPPAAPPPPITRLTLRGVVLQDERSLTGALQALRNTVSELEVACVTLQGVPYSAGGARVTRSLAVGLAGMQRLRTLHYVPESAEMESVPWGHSPEGKALGELVKALGEAGRPTAPAAGQGEGARGAGGGGGGGGGGACTLEVLGLPRTELSLEQWRQLVVASGSLVEVQVHSVKHYDGSLPPRLRRLVMRQVALALPETTDHLQDWGRAPLESVELGLYVHAPPPLPADAPPPPLLHPLLLQQQEQQHEAQLPPPAAAAGAAAAAAGVDTRLAATMRRYQAYCGALARVARVCLQLELSQPGDLGQALETYAPGWDAVLEPLAAVGGLRQLLLLPAQPSSLGGRHLELVSERLRNLEVLGVSVPSALLDRHHGGAALREHGWERRVEMGRLGDTHLRALLGLERLRLVLVHVRAEGVRCRLSRRGLRELAVRYEQRHGRPLAALSEGLRELEMPLDPGVR